MLLIGFDSTPQLYLTTPIGAFWSYKAHAVGMGADQMNTILEQEYSPTLTTDTALRLAVRILKDTASSPLHPEGLVAAKVTQAERRFVNLDVEGVQQLLDSV
jgi:20S proteasome alpha/beta subunit